LFSTHSDTDLDGAIKNGVGDIGSGLQTRRAESVDGRSTGGVGEASGESRGANLVGSLGIGDLLIIN